MSEQNTLTGCYTHTHTILNAVSCDQHIICSDCN